MMIYQEQHFSMEPGNINFSNPKSGDNWDIGDLRDTGDIEGHWDY